MGTAFKGGAVTLKGRLPAVGSKLADFTLVKADLSAVTRKDFSGKTKIILTVPSLDTGVCATETKRFNQEAASVPGVAVLVVSRDLPFAQKRFCTAEGVDKVTTLSDLRDAGFAERYGVALADSPLAGLMARAVIVAGPDDTVKYVELVPEITTEPNYAAALAAAKK
jgi:thioredoxin-dependent peroxiredoxin